MTQTDTANMNVTLAYAPPSLRARLVGSSRVFLTLGDQALVSVANFATNFLILHTVSFNSDTTQYAHYTLAFNLMIWAGEFQSTLVFTPHTICTPRKPASALRRFHGSTLLQNTFVTLMVAIATLIAAGLTRSHDGAMSLVLFTLGLGAMTIGLRNYARPYAFTARQPKQAVMLDLAVAVLQIGGILLLRSIGRLEAWSAIAVIAVASAVPSLVWLGFHRNDFKPSVRHAIEDIREEWPHTRWVFLSGMVWNAGMQLYPWLIDGLAGDYEVAVWGACYQLACVANPLLMGLQNFIGPRIAEAYMEMSRVQFTRYIYQVALYTALLMAGPAVFLGVYADSALSWLTRGLFSGHQPIIVLLCITIVSQSFTFTLSRGLFAIQRADIDLYCNFLPVLTLFSVGIYATHHSGATGAAASMLVAQLLSAVSRAILFHFAATRSEPRSLVAKGAA